MPIFPLARQFLVRIDAERAHGLGLQAIEAAYRSGLNPLLAKPAQALPTKAMGLTFPNPVGLAGYVSTLTGLPVGQNFVSGQGALDTYEQTATTAALFGQSTLHASAQLGLTLGLRYSRIEKDLDVRYVNTDGEFVNDINVDTISFVLRNLTGE